MLLENSFLHTTAICNAMLLLCIVCLSFPQRWRSDSECCVESNLFLSNLCYNISYYCHIISSIRKLLLQKIYFIDQQHVTTFFDVKSLCIVITVIWGWLHVAALVYSFDTLFHHLNGVITHFLIGNTIYRITRSNAPLIGAFIWRNKRSLNLWNTCAV